VFELLRKFSLFMLLFVVAMGTYQTMQNSTSWREPLWVQIYPISGDGEDRTQRYIDRLSEETFISIEQFMKREAQRYGIPIERPIKIILGSQVDDLPPTPPREGGILSIMTWSLKLRWWASTISRAQDGPRPDVRLFLVYFDPEKTQTVAHSLGLQKGLIGIVNVFAASGQREPNNFVAAHEMLHTLGATDKYDYRTNLPRYPDGFGDPSRQPLYPQSNAEIMGGRIMLSDTSATMPTGLKQAVVGAATAAEIRWLK
jgi:hypothetical protein